MNKIFKVIWSKSKQCYVVVSEMAKNTTGKKKIVVASILAGLAMSTMGTPVMAVSSIPFSDKPSSALGNGSVKSGTTNGVALGNAAYSDSNQSIAIGFRSLASGTFLGGSIKPSVAVGAGAHAEGNNTVAIGTVAENRASYGVSLGNESKVTSGSDYGIAIGYQTQVSAVHSMAIGEKASASATLAIALGANAKATGAYSYTAGFNSESGGEAAIAVGKSASASGASAVAVGNGTVATAGDAVAIGTSSQATGGDSIALGKSANASNGDSIAIGQDTVSNNINSVALGKTSKATGASATALGPQAKATGSTAVAIGLNSEANQSATVAVGYNSAASGENAAAYGNTAKAAGKNSLALGANTQATVEGGVALGAGSIANTVAGAGYNPNTGRTNTFTGLSGNALTSTWAAVSIGDGTNTRQLTGLAAGTNNTDAVNVAQLKSMNLAFTADGSTQGDVNLTNSALNVVGDSTYITTKGNNQTLTISGKKQTITVTDGTASASAGMADANNVAQAINQANAAQTISYKANGGTANTVKVSDGLNFTNGTTTVATIGANGQVTYDLNTTTKQSITDSSTAVNRTIALGGSTGSTTAKKLASEDVKFNIKGQTGTNALISTSASGDDVTIAPTSKLTDAVTAAENAANKDLSNLSTAGNTYIKNLAKTAAAWNVSTNGSGTTAVSGGDTVNFVNGDNIAVTNTGRMITIGTAKNVSFDKVTVGGLSIDKTNGINAGNKEIKGLATGTTATSAVNKQQMDDAVKAASDATAALGKNTIALVGDSGSTSAKKLSTSAIAFNIKGDTGANALITTTATGDNVSITPTAKLTNAVAAAENAANKNLSNISSSGETVIKNLAKGAAQDAVKVAGTGLATVSDNTTGGVKTYTVDVNTGNLVVTANGQVGAAGTTGVSGATGSNGVATTQNVATAINDAVTKAKASTTQALADAEHKFAGDTGTTSVRKHGEVLSIKGGVTTPADLSTGNIGVVSDGAGTLNIRLAKVLSGLTSATFTTAGGNTTVINGDGVTITPSGTGASAISMTTDGINAGGTEIKNIADGTAADSAVSKGQMETAIANAQTAATSTEKVVAKTLSGDNNLATVTGQTGTAKGETYEVSVSENAVKNVAKAAAQDAVTVTGTGLATVSDNTAAGVKTYTVNVDEGKLVIDDTTGKVGAAGSTQGTTAGKNGVATTQNVATAINDAVTKANANNAQALADAKHNFAGDDATVISRKHGEQLNIKGGASTTATDLTSGNIAVVGDTASGTLNIKMAKALTGLTSATFTDGSGNTQTITGASSTITDGAGHTTAMTKGGLSTTDGTNTTTVAPAGVTATDGTNTVKLNGSGIDAGNTQIKNVGKATTDDAAVNKKQMDDAVKSATDATTALGNNTIALGSDAGSTTAKKLSTNAITFNIKGDTGANALITTSATGDNVTIAPTAKLTAAVTAAEKSADKDLSNISSAGKTVIKDLAVTSAQDAVNVTGTGLATVSDNTTGGVKTYTVNVDEGKLVLDDTTGQIGANGSTQGTTAGKNGVATTQNVATAINDAIAKSNANAAQALADAEHKFDGDTGTTSVRKHGEVLSIKGGVANAADLATGNIGVVSDGAGTLNIRLAKVLSGLTSATFKDASGNTTMVTGGSTTIADTSGNTQTLAPTKSEIKDNNGVSTVTTKDGVTAKDASGQTTSLTKGGVDATDGNGNTTSLTNTGVSATDGNGHTTGLTNGGLSTTDGTNTTTVVPTGITATDGTNTVKLNGSGIDAGNTEIKNVGKATTDDAAVNKKQMDDAITKATADATHEFGGDDATVVSRKHGEKLTIKGGATTTDADLTSGNIAVIGDATNGALNIKLAKALTGLTSATYTDTAGNTTTVTGGSTTIADTSGNTQTLAPTKSEIKDNNGVSTVTTKDGVTAKDASGQTTSLTKGGVDATDGNGNTTSLTNTGVSATDGNGHTTGLTNGGLSTTDGTNTTTVVPTGITATDGTNTVKLNGSGIDAGNTEIKNVGKATTDDAAVNKKQMDDAITKATADATHEFGGDDATVVSRKHGEKLTIKGGATTTDADLTSGNIAVIGDATNGALNIKLAKALTGLTSATYTDTAGNTTTVTGGSTTIADTSGNTQTLAPTKSEIKDNNGVSTVTTKDGVTAKDASGQTTSLTKGGVDATDGHGNTTSLTNTGVSATDGNGHTTGLTNGGLSTTDGANTTTVAPTGMTATDGTNTVKVEGSGIDAGGTQIKNVGKATTDDAAVNKKQMDDAITKATADATHEFAGDTGNNSVRKHGEVLSIKGGVANAADLTTGNIGVVSDGAGTLNIRLAKALTGLTSATFTDIAGNTTTVTGGSTTIADTSGNTQTLAPTKSEIKDNNGVSTVTTKDGVTAKDASGQTTSLTKGGVDATDGNGNTTSLTNTGVSATDGHGHTTGLTNGGLSTTDGTNTTTVAPTGMTATDGTHTVKVEGSGIDAGGTQIKNVGKATTDDAAVNKKQMDDAITKATADATHEFAGDTGNNSVRKHGEVLSIKGGVTDTNKLSDNNIGVISDGAGTLNVKLSKDLTGLTSATFTDGSGNTQTVTGGSSTITDGAGNITTITKDGVTTTDAAGNTTTTAPTGVTVTPAGAGATPISVTTSGISAGNKEIKNVANGTTDDAAVNKKQMDDAVKAATDATTALGNNTIALGDDSGSTTTAKTLNTTGGIQFNIKGQTGTDALITTSASGDDVTITPTDKLTNAVKAAEKSADKDLSNLSAAGNTHIQDLAKSAASWNVQTNGSGTTAVSGGDTVNFINGDNIAITNTGHAITIGTAKNVSFDKVTVGGMTLDKNGLLSGITSITGAGSGAPTMTFNSQNGNTPANVSINSNLDMGGHRITGVGPAEKPTDAVNKQQVDQALRGLTGMADNAARQYASKAGANAAALAALKPIQYDPLEPTQIMAGVGNYKSQTAVALGMAHYTNENTMFNIGVSLDSHDNMVNAGVTHKFGYSPEKKAIPDRYKGGPISSIYVMQDEMQALLAKDQEKDAVISKQASEIDTLRQQNEDMQRKIEMILAKLQ